MLGAFLVGVGIFQVPAGFAAMRWGSRRISLIGIAVMGMAGTLSGFAPSWEWLAGIRFVAGVGAAFFFSPALSLVSSYFPPGPRGTVIGLYNGGFSIGGAAGLGVGALVGATYGWPAALVGGGIALLLTTLVAWALLPRQSAEESTSDLHRILQRSRAILRSRSLWALSFGLLGFWSAVYIVAQYFVEYVAAVHATWGLATAALMAALVVVVSFPGGPVGGWLSERGGDRRLLLMTTTVLSGCLVLSIPFAPFLVLWPILAALGFLDGMGFAVLYVIPSYLTEMQGEGLALGLAVVNSIQVLCGGGLAVAFGFIVAGYGFMTAWLYAGALAILFVPLVLAVSPSRARHRGQREELRPALDAPLDGS